MRLVIAVAVVALGCGKREKPTTCADAARASVEAIVKSAKADARPPLEAHAPALRATLTSACVDDNWSADAIACFAKAASSQDLAACSGKLAADARTRLDAELEAAATPVATPVATPETTPVAATDEMGSASAPPASDERRHAEDQLRAVETKLDEARHLARQATTDADREAAQAVIKELDTQMQLLDRRLGPDREQELDRQMDELNRKIDEVREQLGETSP